MFMRQLPRCPRLSHWSRAMPSYRQHATVLRLLRLEERITPAISLQAGIDGGGNLVVFDFGGFNNNLTITFDGVNYVITDAVEQFVAAPPGGFLNNANKTLNMPAAAFPGKIIVQANNGADALMADWTVQPLGRDIDFIGGLLNDQLLHKGGFDSVVETDTGAGQGNLVMTPTGGGPARTVNFATTEALDFVNCAVTDMSVTLNPIADSVFLEDEGVPGDGLSRLRSTGPNQLVRRFINMSNGLTVLRGTAADTVAINATPDFSKSLVIGSAANKFEWLIVSGKMSFGSGTSMVAHASSIDIGNTLDGAAALIQCSASSISLAGTGVVSSTAGTCQIKLTADSMSLNGTSIIDATSTGTVTLAPLTSGRSIDLGGSDTGASLGLTDEECDTITAGTLKIGDATSGSIALSASLNLLGATTLRLQSNSAIVYTAGMINVEALTMSAAGGIGTSINPVQTAVGSLNVIAAGNAFIQEVDSVNIYSVSVGSTTLSVAAGGNLSIGGEISVLSGTVELKSTGGSILQGTGGKISATHLVLDSDTDCGTELARIEVETCDDADLSSDSGSIYMHFKSNVAILQMTVDPGETCDSNGDADFTIGGTVSGGTVKLTAGGSILQDAGGLITAVEPIFGTDDGIGLLANPVKVASGALSVSCTTGNVFIQVTNSIVLTSATVGGTTLSVAAGGNITVGGTLTCTTGSIILTSTGGSILHGAGGTLSAGACTVTADGDIGTALEPIVYDCLDLCIDADEDNYGTILSATKVTSGTAGGTLEVTCAADFTIGGTVSGDTVRITASGSIMQGTGGKISATHLVLDSDTDCGTELARIEVETCDDADLSSDSGSIYMHFKSDVAILQMTVDPGETCDSNGEADFTIAGPIAGGTVKLTAGGSIMQGTGGLISSDTLSLIAGVAVGASTAPIMTTTGFLITGSTNGSAFIQETDSLTIKSASFGSTTLTCSAGGNITLDGNVSATGGRIELTTSGGIFISSGLVTATTVECSTGGNIGSATAPLVTTCDFVALKSVGGDVVVQENDALTLGVVRTDSGTTAGNIFISAAGSITVSDAIDARGKGAGGSGGSVTLISSSGSILIPATGSIDASGSGTGNGGSISLTAGGALTIESSVKSHGGGAGGGGGSIQLAYGGDLNIKGSIVSAATGSNGNGGNIQFNGTASDPGTGNPIYVWAVSIDASGAGSGMGGNISLSAGSIVLLPGSSLLTTGGSITLKSNNLNIDAAGICDAGGGSVFLLPHKSGWAIDLGGADSGSVLGITDAELDRIKSGSISVGSSTAGTITVTTAITPLQCNSLYLSSGGSCVCSVGGSITISSLSVTTFGDIGTLANPLKVDVDTLACTSNGGDIIPEDTDEVLVMFMSTAPVSGNGGSVSLQAGGHITISGTIDTRGTGATPATGKGGNITLIASSSGSIGMSPGSLLDSSGSTAGGGAGNISLTAGGSISIYRARAVDPDNLPGDWSSTGQFSISATTLNPGSSITLQSSGSIETHSTDGQGGSIMLLSAGDITVSGNLASQGGGAGGGGGSFQLIASNGGSIVLNSGAIDASGSGTGNGGSITIQASGACQQGNCTIVSKGGASGNGGVVSLRGDTIVDLQRMVDVTGTKGGSVTLSSDSIALGGSCTINVGVGGDHTFKPVTPGRAIDFGGPDSPTRLGITNAEFNRIKGGKITIGSATSGTIFVTSAISASENALICWMLGSSVECPVGGSISVSTLHVSTTGNIGSLSDPLDQDCDTVDYVTKGGHIFVEDSDEVLVTFVTTSPTNGNGGSIALKAGGSITVAGPIDVRGNGVNCDAGDVKLSAELGDSIELKVGGRVDANGFGSGNGGTVGLVSFGPMTIAGEVNTSGGGGGGSVSIETKNPGSAINILATGSIGTSSSAGIGGSVTLQSAGDCLMSGPINAKGYTGGGNVSIAVSGKYENGLIDLDCSLSGPIGNGGDISLQASTITLGGNLRAEGGSGGAITLTAGTSLVQNAGQISTPNAVTVNATATFHSLGNKAGNLVIPLARPVTIHGSFDGNAQNTGVLRGTGTVGTVTVLAGGVISPGESPGKLTTGSVVFNSGSTFAIELDGPAAGTQYDQLAVNGTVSLGNASLAVTTGYAPANGQVFKIIDNDGTLDDVTGTFNGYSEGATIGVGPITYLISYKGGDGNDVTLTAQVTVPTATVTFGDGTNQRSMVKQIVVTFSEAVNFAGTVADAFTLFRSGSNTPTGNVTLAANPPTGPASAVTITFSGSFTANGSLNDGFYDFTIDADQVTGIGGKLNGGTDYTVIGNTTNKYFRLFGDGNGSGVVDLGDFAQFRGAFNLGANSIYDYGEGDSNVGLADFAQFRVRFNLSP